VRLKAGAHVIRFQLTGHREVTRPVELVDGESRLVDVTLVPNGAPPGLTDAGLEETTEPAREDRVMEIIGWSLVGVGVAVGAGIGTWCLTRAAEAREDAEGLGLLAGDDARHAALEDEYQAQRTAGAIAIGVGAAAVAAGVAMVVWGGTPGRSTTAGVAPGSAGGTAFLGGTF
jgi:hypothetical protein